MFENLNYLDAMDLIKTRKEDPNLPQELLKFYTDPFQLCIMCYYIFKKRVEEFEEIISTDKLAIHMYAKDVIKGKLPEFMHNKMIASYILNPDCHLAKSYFNFIERKNDLT